MIKPPDTVNDVAVEVGTVGLDGVGTVGLGEVGVVVIGGVALPCETNAPLT